jgi:DNA polymerase-3 subunit epsilon
VAEIKGYGAKFVVGDDSIAKVSSRLTGLIAGVGARISYADVRAINFRAASVLRNGHLQVISAKLPPGSPSASEPCTVLFSRSQQPEFERLANWLNEVVRINQGLGLVRRTPEALGLPPGLLRADLTRSSRGPLARDQVFTAVDLETTGLDAADGAIVEVGVVKFNGAGEVLDEFTTLVRSPGSHLAARDVHGINETELVNAPAIGDVLREVWYIVNGSVLVAHNLEFDASFLMAESQRAGIRVPGTIAVCTMQTARRQLEGRSFSLKAMYKVATGEFPLNAHSALADARATKDVLLWLLSNAPEALRMPEGFEQPESDLGERPCCAMLCRPVPMTKPSLSALLESFPRSTTQRPGFARAVAAYEHLLGRVLEDERLTTEEIEALITEARQSGLTGNQLRDLHGKAWTETFGADATADWRTLTPVRRREMLIAAQALGLDQVAEELKHLIDQLAEPAPSEHSTYLKKLRVAFATDDPEAELVRKKAEEYGAKIAVNVTATVGWFGTSTPGSGERRHAKARELGVPVLTCVEAEQRLDDAIAAAELDAFERRQAAAEAEFRMRQRRTEQESYWRPVWLRQELDHDPEWNRYAR